MNANARIEQFKKMTDSDPENELGHFSLGSAYLEAGRLDDAVISLRRALEINSKLSKVYQILGDAYQQAGKHAEAIDVLTRGVAVAEQQGDRMPCDVMVGQLRALGAPVPNLKSTTEATAHESGTSGGAAFRCARCGAPTGQLPKRPFKGALGEKVLAQTCAACWREWILMGTKVINELGLVLSTPEGQQVYDQYLVEFLQIEPA